MLRKYIRGEVRGYRAWCGCCASVLGPASRARQSPCLLAGGRRSIITPSPLVHAFDYGVSHSGKLFKPTGKVLQPPQITRIYGYQKGVLDYFSLTYSDPDHDAKGFGFVGINGAGWVEENHPFSSPSYGIVGHDRIDYPFNLLCGTPQEYKSWVEAWIYDSQGIRSKPVEIVLTCTT